MSSAGPNPEKELEENGWVTDSDCDSDDLEYFLNVHTSPIPAIQALAADLKRWRKDMQKLLDELDRIG